MENKKKKSVSFSNNLEMTTNQDFSNFRKIFSNESVDKVLNNDYSSSYRDLKTGNNLLGIGSIMGIYDYVKTLYSLHPNLVDEINNEELNPLMVSILNYMDFNKKCIMFLIRKSNLNFCNSKLISAFSLACKSNNLEICNAILDRGINNINLRDKHGIIPLMKIKNLKHMYPVILRILNLGNNVISNFEEFKIFNIDEFEISRDIILNNNIQYTYAKHILSGVNCTLKFHDLRKQLFQDLINDIMYIKNVKSDSIVKIYGLIYSENSIILVLEDLTYSFYQIAESYYINEDFEKLKELFRNCLISLLNVHKRGYFHSDIKRQNIMIDYSLKVKFIDFGISNFLGIGPEKEILKEYICTVSTKSFDCMGEFILNINGTPETYVSSNKNYSSDVFSLCQIFVEIFLGKNINCIYDGNKMIYHVYKNSDVKISTNYLRFDDEMLEKLNLIPNFLDLVMNMCHINSKNRFTVVDCLNHPFFGENIILNPRLILTNLNLEIPKCKIFFNISKFSEIFLDKKENYLNRKSISQLDVADNYCNIIKYVEDFNEIEYKKVFYLYYLEYIAHNTTNMDVLINSLYILKKFSNCENLYEKFKNIYQIFSYFFQYYPSTTNLIITDFNFEYFNFMPILVDIENECYKMYMYGVEKIKNLVEIISRYVLIYVYSINSEIKIKSLIQTLICMVLKINIYEMDEEIIKNMEFLLNFETDPFCVFLKDFKKTNSSYREFLGFNSDVIIKGMTPSIISSVFMSPPKSRESVIISEKSENPFEDLFPDSNYSLENVFEVNQLSMNKREIFLKLKSQNKLNPKWNSMEHVEEFLEIENITIEQIEYLCINYNSEFFTLFSDLELKDKISLLDMKITELLNKNEETVKLLYLKILKGEKNKIVIILEIMSYIKNLKENETVYLMLNDINLENLSIIKESFIKLKDYTMSTLIDLTNYVKNDNFSKYLKCCLVLASKNEENIKWLEFLILNGDDCYNKTLIYLSNNKPKTFNEKKEMYLSSVKIIKNVNKMDKLDEFLNLNHDDFFSDLFDFMLIFSQKEKYKIANLVLIYLDSIKPKNQVESESFKYLETIPEESIESEIDVFPTFEEKV